MLSARSASTVEIANATLACPEGKDCIATLHKKPLNLQEPIPVYGLALAVKYLMASVGIPASSRLSPNSRPVTRISWFPVMSPVAYVVSVNPPARWIEPYTVGISQKSPLIELRSAMLIVCCIAASEVKSNAVAPRIPAVYDHSSLPNRKGAVKKEEASQIRSSTSREIVFHTA